MGRYYWFPGTRGTDAVGGTVQERHVGCGHRARPSSSGPLRFREMPAASTSTIIPTSRPCVACICPEISVLYRGRGTRVRWASDRCWEHVCGRARCRRELSAPDSGAGGPSCPGHFQHSPPLPAGAWLFQRLRPTNHERYSLVPQTVFFLLCCAQISDLSR